jgi:hyperosmotically inducible periplasmic protein
VSGKLAVPTRCAFGASSGFVGSMRASLPEKSMTKKHLLSTLTMGAALLLGPAALTQAIAQTPSANDSDAMTSGAGRQIDDSWITTKVKSELATTDGVSSTDINVTTVDGNVTLIGVLPSKVAVRKAIAVTRSIKGVKKVDASGLKASG